MRNKPKRKPGPAKSGPIEKAGPRPAPGRLFPIAGIGASAGGLEAFLALLKGLPTDTGIGFVLVQHLDPVHESALPQLLARATHLPVREAVHNQPVEPNHVYVIPPNTRLAIAHGVLKLFPREKSGSHRSIDYFFESLARDRRERAIGVILSGTATDGTLGLEAIRAEGGITFAQDESARYDSMPRSAIAAKCVDLVLSPAEIANEMARIARHPWVARPISSAQPAAAAAEGASGGHSRRRRPSSPAENGLKEIIVLLRNRTGADFSLYKSNTIQRRINRRMVLSKQSTTGSYAHFLRDNPDELDALYADMLISVTDFFRNPEAFDALRTKVFPTLLQHRREPLRAWVPGCSTGQEAYSLAMTLMEFCGNAVQPPKLNIFATDLNEAALERARSGLYSKALLANLSPGQIRRFFDEDGDAYRVNKGLREMCIFARQNLISDPPFSRMDLISCRNVLIYLDPGLQQRILPAFHYALKPGGFLLLGASESIGSFGSLFEIVDKKQKIFSRKNRPTPPFHLSIPRPQPEPKAQLAASRPGGWPEKFGFELTAEREADRVTVNQIAPPGVLVNSGLQVLQFRGDTGPYLRSPAGRATFDVLKMAHPDLRLPLRAAIADARKGIKPVRRQNLHVGQNGRTRRVNLEIIPLKNVKEPCFLILFGSAAPSAKDPAPAAPKLRPGRESARSTEARRRIVELERELSEARDYNQTLQEGHEAADEELQSQSEEMQSANEELQSINEELETSKEELESANEELTTVNEEMANRNAELGRLNSDFNNLQLSIQTAVLVLGRDLLIRRFTAPAEKPFNVRTADIGRPLGAIKSNLDCPDLERLVAEVVDTVSPREREVRDLDGRWYSLRIRPYLTIDNKIDGAVLMAVDIEALKRSEREIENARNFAEAILRTTHYPFVVLNHDLRVRVANAAFYKAFKVSPLETEGRVFYDLGNGQWNIPKLRIFLDEILPRNSFFDDFEVTHEFEGIGRRTMLLNARRLDLGESGGPKGILLAIDDITESTRLENVRLSEAHYRRFFEGSLVGMLVLDSRTQRVTDVNRAMTELLGYNREEFLKRELWEIGLVADAPASHAVFLELQSGRCVRIEALLAKSKSGETRVLTMVGNSYDEEDRQVVQLLFSPGRG